MMNPLSLCCSQRNKLYALKGQTQMFWINSSPPPWFPPRGYFELDTGAVIRSAEFREQWLCNFDVGIVNHILNVHIPF